MTLKIDTKFERKLNSASKNDLRNLANFTRALESLNIGTLMASFCLKLKMCELENYKGVMCHGSAE